MIDEQTVRDVGEFGLIAQLEDALPAEVRAGADVVLGIGDDAAVWRPAPFANVVVTTDSLVENVHFRRDWTDWHSLGHKTLAVNVSDIAAMGARPRLAFVTLGLRGDELVDDLRDLYRGLGDVARRFGMVVAGGDIVRSPHDLVLHVTVLGETSGRRILSRAGALAGDVIGVTGTLGASAAGLSLLGMDDNDPRRRAATAEHLIAAHLRPEPRVALGSLLREQRATAAMDLSDGLLGDLPKLLEASNVSARLDISRIPVAAAVRALFPDKWLEFALRGGEDYELLFTAPVDVWDDIVREARATGGQVSSIGEIVARDGGDLPSGIELVDRDGTAHAVLPGAFDHFGTS
jgi:thiamine-monophosphate kinase